MSEKVMKREISAEDRQFNRNKWLFTVSGFGRDMSYQLIASFLLTYIQFGTTLSVLQFTVISLLIGVVGRIWDAINDPMMGAIIEGSHMKFGKFRPWILIGAVLTGAIIIAMFNVQSVSGWGFVVFMAVMYLLWESAFTMNDIGLCLQVCPAKSSSAIKRLRLPLFSRDWARSWRRALYPSCIRGTSAWRFVG